MSKTITLNHQDVDMPVRVDELQRLVRGERNRPDSGWIFLRLVTCSDDGKSWSLTPRGEDLLASAHLIPDDPAPEQPSATPCEACNGTGERVLFVNMQVCDVCQGSKVKPTAITYSPSPYVTAPRPGLTSPTGKRAGALGFSVAVHNEPDGTLIKTEHHSDGRVVRLRHNAHGYWVVDSITTPEVPSPEPNPWVLIDSEDVARSFVGKDVEVDAPASGDYPQSGWHGSIMHVEYSSDTSLFAPSGDIAWRLRGNVRLRVVGGSDV